LPATLKDRLSELTKVRSPIVCTNRFACAKADTRHAMTSFTRMRGQGYCGADLRALCTEAALRAVRRHYPQIYKTNRRLLLDPSKIEVLPADFAVAHAMLVPASRRVMPLAVDRPLPLMLLPLLSNRVQAVFDKVLGLLGLGGHRLLVGQSGKGGSVGAADRLDDDAEAALAILLADSPAAASQPADAAGAAGPVARRLLFDALADEGATSPAPFVPRVARGVFRPRMTLLEDSSPLGTEAIVRAALHACNGITLVSLEHAVLLADPSRSPEVRRSQPVRACDASRDADRTCFRGRGGTVCGTLSSKQWSLRYRRHRSARRRSSFYRTSTPGSPRRRRPY